MKIYGSLLSPFVRKVAVVAAEKGIAFEFAQGGPAHPDAEFVAASPFRKMPAINDDGFMLSDSTAIALYLEARNPDPALLPAGAQARGRAIWFDEFADTVLGAAGLKIMFNRLVGPRILKIGGDEAVAQKGAEELPATLDYLESVAPPEGWLVGDRFGLADISVASILRTMDYCKPCVDAAARPRTAAWYARVIARPTWAAVAVMEEKQARRIMPQD